LGSARSRLSVESQTAWLKLIAERFGLVVHQRTSSERWLAHGTNKRDVVE